MSVMILTEKESALAECANMILFDQCPPDRMHYLCMKEEDDTICNCTQCWRDYLWGIRAGTIKLPSKK